MSTKPRRATGVKKRRATDPTSPVRTAKQLIEHVRRPISALALVRNPLAETEPKFGAPLEVECDGTIVIDVVDGPRARSACRDELASRLEELRRVPNETPEAAACFDARRWAELLALGEEALGIARIFAEPCLVGRDINDDLHRLDAIDLAFRQAYCFAAELASLPDLSDESWVRRPAWEILVAMDELNLKDPSHYANRQEIAEKAFGHVDAKNYEKGFTELSDRGHITMRKGTGGCFMNPAGRRYLARMLMLSDQNNYPPTTRQRPV